MRRVVCFALLVLSFCGAEARGGIYTFVNIADPSDGLAGAFGSPILPPSINDSGVVVFRGRINGVNGIYAGSGGPLTTVVDVNTAGIFAFVDETPGLNKHGDIVFTFNSDAPGTDKSVAKSNVSSPGSYTVVAAPDVQVGSTPATGTLNTAFTDPDINDQGSIVGNLQTNQGRLGPHVAGGPVTGTGQFDAFLGQVQGSATEAAINAAGHVAYQSHFAQEVYFYDGTSTVVRQAATAAGQVLNIPDMNDSDKIAFVWTGNAVTNGIYVNDAVNSTTPYATVGADFSGFFQHPLFASPGINNTGTVAFLASSPSIAPFLGSQLGLFIGPDPIADRVLAVGDVIFGGKRVTDIRFYQGINNAGQLALLVDLLPMGGNPNTDQFQAIIRADPAQSTSVPEPSSWMLAASALVGFSMAAGRRCGRRLSVCCPSWDRR